MNRDELVQQARELGCFDDPEAHTDEQLLGAIRCEQAATTWLDRLEQLPDDAAKRAAVGRLRSDLEQRSRNG